MAFTKFFEVGERYLGRVHLLWWIIEIAISLSSGALGGWWAHANGFPSPLIALTVVGAFVVAATVLTALYIVITWLGSRTVWKSSPRGIRVVIGSDAPFHNYKTKLYKRYHLIRIGIKNDSQDVALTNCEVELHTISGMFSQRCPISKSGFTLNPGAILYVDFVGLEESGSDAAYDAMDRKYGIRTYFPINPLPSDGSSWLDDQPYNISLLATAAESRPHRLDCRLFVEDGILMLRAADDHSVDKKPNSPQHL